MSSTSNGDGKFDGFFWGAIIVYSTIMGIGFINPMAGAIGLGIFAIIAFINMIIKNAAVMLIMIALAILCVSMPFLLIVYIPLLIFFFIKRLGFFFQHFPVVATGLAIYFIPIYGFIQAGATNYQSGVFAIILSPVIFSVALFMFVQKGYTARKALEIMSEAPILIVSIILPFLKLSFGAEMAAVPSHGAEVALATTGDAALASHVISTTPVEAASPITPSIEPHVITHTPPVLNHHTPTLATSNNLEPFAHNTTTTTIQGADGLPTGHIVTHGNSAVIQGANGLPVAHTVTHGNSTTIQGADGLPIGKVITQGDSATIQGANGLPVAQMVTHSNYPTLANDSVTTSTMAAHNSVLQNMDLQANQMAAATHTPAMHNLNSGVIPDAIPPHDAASQNIVTGHSSIASVPSENIGHQAFVEPAILARNNELVKATRMSLSDFFIKEQSQGMKACDRLYLKGAIPRGHLANAENTFDVDRNDIILLLDDAAFSGGKKGMALTENTILLKSDFAPVVKAALSEISVIKAYGLLFAGSSVTKGVAKIDLALVKDKERVISDINQILVKYRMS